MVDKPTPYEPDPLTQLFPLLVGAATWHEHGSWMGLLALVAYVVFTIAANVVYMATLAPRSANPIRGFQRLKWILFILAMSVITITGAQA